MEVPNLHGDISLMATKEYDKAIHEAYIKAMKFVQDNKPDPDSVLSPNAIVVAASNLTHLFLEINLDEDM